MKSAVISLSVFATVALAASSPLIPTGISTECSAYLSKLNSNSAVAACVAPLISATAAFAPGSTANPGSVSSALTTLCAPATLNACPETMIRTALTSFYAACTEDLTTKSNTDVTRLYDTLYMLTPFYDAVCVKNEAGQFCAAQASSAAPGASAQQYLGAPVGGVVVPNATAFGALNLPFLLIQPSASSDQLCTKCTRDVMVSYIQWETSISYAPGLPKSQLLATQSKLYQSIVGVCGTSFLSSAVQAAGSLGAGLINSKNAAASLTPISVVVSALGAIFVGIATTM